jgi:hypothetical protein
VSFASSDLAPVSYPSRSLFGRAPGAKLVGLMLFPYLTQAGSGWRGLERLAKLVADGRLDCSIDLEDTWRGAADAIAALIERRVAGKVVLRVD